MSKNQNISIVRAGKSHANAAADLVHRLLSELAGGNGPALEELTLTTQRLFEEGLVLGVIAIADIACGCGR